MENAAAFALVMLAELPHVGERTLTRLSRLSRQRHIERRQLLDLPPECLAAEYGLAPQALARLTTQRATHERHCHRLLDRLRAAAIRISEPSDREYPYRWLHRAALSPPIVYLRGNRRILDAPTVAILNSRNVTERAVSAAAAVVRQAGREGFAAITGGMKASYRITTVAVRATALLRVVVLDRGIFAACGSRPDRDPFGFGPGRARLDPGRTLVVSAFRPDDHASPRSGQRRDTLIAALADIIVVPHARPGGVIERTCLHALDRGQCVLSWQGESETLLSAGAAPADSSDLDDGLRRLIPRS